MNSNLGEYGKIVCAALLHDNCIYIARNGHHEIFPMEPIGVLRCAKQGFVTENGYFVDRDLGLNISMFYNQISNKYNPLDKLVSEDLKKENLKVKKRKEYLYKEKQKGIIMKTYTKEQLIKEIVAILKYYSEDKENLLYANYLMNKVNEEEIAFEKEEIEKYLFRKDNGEINKVVFNSLRCLEVSLDGISFDGKIIEGLNFSGLEDVEINLDKVPDKNIKNVTFNGVKLLGSLDNAIVENTDFTGYIGEISLNPQTVKERTIKGSKLAGIVIDGTFDDININSVDFTNVKGNVEVNPQKLQNKDLMGINFCGVKLIGENNNDPVFDNCSIYDCKFKGAKGNIIINLDTLNDSLFPKLSICDLTGVVVIGNAKSNYPKAHCVRKDGAVLFDTVGDDLFGSYYYDENNDYVHIYLYESMVWDKKKECWKYIPKKKERNLRINISYKQTEEKEKPKILNLVKKKKSVR